MLFKKNTTCFVCLLIVSLLACGFAQIQSLPSENPTNGGPDGAINPNNFGGMPSSFSQYMRDIGNALIGCLIGFILLVFSISVMFKIEHALVDFQLISYRCNEATQIIEDSEIYRPEFESWPVLLKGRTEALDSVSLDKETGFQADHTAIKLKRTVEMYQWDESEYEEERNGRMVTKYKYERKWLSYDQDSSRFEEYGHDNPRREPDLSSITISSQQARVGIYELSTRQIEMLDNFQDCGLKHKTDAMSQALPGDYVLEDNYILLHGNAEHATRSGKLSLSHPHVGNVRIKYEVIYDHGPITTLGVLQGRSFRGFTKADAKVDNMLAICEAQDSPDEAVHHMAELGLRDGTHSVHHRPNTCEVCGLVSHFLNLASDYIVGSAVSKDILLVETCTADIETMFSHSLNNTSFKVNLVRLGGTILIIVSLNLIFGPIPAIVEFIPFLNSAIDWAVQIACFILGLIISFFVYCLASIFFRPEYMLLCTLGCSVFFYVGGNKHTDSVGTFWLIASLVPIGIMVYNFINQAGYDSYLKERLQELRSRIVGSNNSITKGVEFPNYSAIPKEDPFPPAPAPSSVVSPTPVPVLTPVSTSVPASAPPVEPSEESSSDPDESTAVPTAEPSSQPVESTEESAPTSAEPVEESAPASVESAEESAPASVEPAEESAPASVEPAEESAPASVEPVEESAPASVEPVEESAPADSNSASTDASGKGHGNRKGRGKGKGGRGGGKQGK